MIKPLIDVVETDLFQFGGKAINLGKLCRGGFQVPRGFALSSDIFNDLLRPIGSNRNPGGILAASDDIAEGIRCTELSTELRSQVRAIEGELSSDGSTVSVRSSCMYEDSEESSFAGIYESYTDLHTFESVIQAIKDCIASIYSDGALEFAIRHELDLCELGMGIIIQKHVPGAPSGVVFTVDAVEMDSQSMIVHAVNGPCSDFVNGTLRSQQIRVDRKTRGIIVSDSLALTPAQTKRLVSYSLEIERVMGSYQDIEWTISDGDFHFLQTRPITTYRTKIRIDNRWNILINRMLCFNLHSICLIQQISTIPIIKSGHSV